MSVRGYSSPRSPEGRSSLVPYPPWHYVGDFLVIEYWADPDAVRAVLPPGLEPHPDAGPLRGGLRRLAVVLGAAATSWSTRRARSTRSSSSSSTRCSTARR